jgi:hypothetical protein
MPPITEVLTALRENRRGKGLYVEPTDCQVMQIWEGVNFFQDAIVSRSFPNKPATPSLASASRKSAQSTVRLKIQYAARIFSSTKAT